MNCTYLEKIRVTIDDGPAWTRSDIIQLLGLLLMVIIPTVGFIYHRTLPGRGMSLIGAS
jgi:hypothetical protein